MTIIVIADTVRHAREIVSSKSYASNSYATSLRAVKYYNATRGIANVAAVLVHESVWPLDQELLELFEPAPVCQIYDTA